MLGLVQVALVARDQLAIELAAREGARAAAVSAAPAAAARAAVERAITIRPVGVDVAVGPSTVTVTVSTVNHTDVAIVGGAIGDANCAPASRWRSSRPDRADAASYPALVDLQVRVALVGDTPTIALGGLVDLGSVPILQDVLTRAVLDHPGETIVVDLDGVVSFDDTALGLLLAAAGRARELGGELEIVCTSDRLLARLASTRFDRAVTVRQA